MLTNLKKMPLFFFPLLFLIIVITAYGKLAGADMTQETAKKGSAAL